MNWTNLKQNLLERCPQMKLREHEPMSRHTTFRIGGPAALMAFVKDEAEFKAALQAAEEAKTVPYVMGNGSNVLAADGDLDVFVIVTTEGMDRLERTGDTEITCGVGVSMARLATFAMEQGLTGLEFAHGIPGSVGGGIYMNAGAYGGEIKDVAVESHYLTLGGEAGVLRGPEQDLSYRHSAYSVGDKFATEVVFRLAHGDRETIRSRMAELAEKRRSRQPLDKPSAGSTFKRPAQGYAAALIEQCGLKGYTVGGAQVSEKHAGFVINCGGATCADVVALTDHIHNVVYEQTGIELEMEVRRLG